MHGCFFPGYGYKKAHAQNPALLILGLVCTLQVSLSSAGLISMEYSLSVFSRATHITKPRNVPLSIQENSQKNQTYCLLLQRLHTHTKPNGSTKQRHLTQGPLSTLHPSIPLPFPFPYQKLTLLCKAHRPNTTNLTHALRPANLRQRNPLRFCRLWILLPNLTTQSPRLQNRHHLPAQRQLLRPSASRKGPSSMDHPAIQQRLRARRSRKDLARSHRKRSRTRTRASM